MILAIRTDRPLAELYLCNNGIQIANVSWQAHRELADTLLGRIKQLLTDNNVELKHLRGIIVFTGIGSFTGLRIGTVVANTLAYSLDIPVTATTGPDWLSQGLEGLLAAKLGEYVVPEYHSEPNITKSKKLTLEEQPK